MNLFIIGNGFDLGHHLPTHYSNFRMFLEEHYPVFLEDFEEKYDLWGEKSKTPLWREFESYLADIQEEILVEQMYQFTDLGLESGHIDIEDTLKHHFKGEINYIEKLTIYLKEWIGQINRKLTGMTRRTSFIKKSSHDIFLNFNYTTTLEDLYSIKEENVLHIHGVITSEEDLILGHSDSEKIAYFREKYNEYRNIGDERNSSIYYTLAEYCSITYKNVMEHLDQLIYFGFNSIEEIMIIGHSLGDVDLPYFEEINRRVGRDVKWNVYYFSETEKNGLKDKIKGIGVNEQRIRMIHSSDFYDLPILEQILLKI